MGFWADDGQVGIYRFVHRISTHKRASRKPGLARHSTVACFPQADLWPIWLGLPQLPSGS